jgi:hypothetical protein
MMAILMSVAWFVSIVLLMSAYYFRSRQLDLITGVLWKDLLLPINAFAAMVLFTIPVIYFAFSDQTVFDLSLLGVATVVNFILALYLAKLNVRNKREGN